MTSLDEKKFDWLCRMGDTDLVLMQRLCEWCGHGPITEEDMALSNVGLDLIGQSRLWYAVAVEIEGKARSEDDLAYLRDAPQWRNHLIAEQPNGNYGDTMMRQFLFDTWHYFALKGLLNSSDQRFADVAQKAIKEVTYHVRRSADMVIRLGDGSEQSHAKMQAAAKKIWAFTGEMFTDDETDRVLAQAQVSPLPSSLHDAWRAHVEEVFTAATLLVPEPGWMQGGGKQGRHSEHFGFLLAEMQFLQRAYPGATW